MTYETIKTVHLLGAIILFGTGLGTAFQMWRADRTGDARVIAAVARNVVAADWLFTTPAIVLQPITGLMLAGLGGWSLASGWIVVSIALYVVAGACWLPVVWLQRRMARLAAAAARDNQPLPDDYHRLARFWFWLGWPAFGAALVILHLMVAKPELAV